VRVLLDIGGGRPGNRLRLAVRDGIRIIHVRLTASTALGLALVAVVAGCGGTSTHEPSLHALPTRAPTSRERHGLAAAMNKREGESVAIRHVKILRDPSGWASLQCAKDCPPPDRYAFVLVRKRADVWKAYVSEPRLRLIYLCAYGPRAVIHDLFGAVCPPERDVHARPPTKAELRGLNAAIWGGPFVFEPCVSRLDPRWAAGYVNEEDQYVVFLHRSPSGRWSRVWAIGRGTMRPSNAVLLSLSSCLGLE
jgi:hypothetical protein